MPKQPKSGSCPFILTDNKPCEQLMHAGHSYCPFHERVVQRNSERNK